MKLFFVTVNIVCVCIYSQCLFAQSKVDYSKAGDHAAVLVSKLPEVIKADQQCQKLSKGKRHLVTFVGGDPTADNNYFLVKVAEDNGYTYHAWFIFNVDAVTNKIFYCDPVTGENIPLQKWRKHHGA